MMNKSNIMNITRLRWLLVRILRDKTAIANCHLGLNLQRQLPKKTDPDNKSIRFNMQISAILKRNGIHFLITSTIRDFFIVSFSFFF